MRRTFGARSSALLRVCAAFVFRFRDYLAPVLVVVILASSRPGSFVADPVLDACLALVGVALLALGLGMRLLVAGQVDIRRSGVDRRVAASRLVVSGMYAHTRNPLYVANASLILGLTLIYDSRPVYVVFPLVVLAFLIIVAHEEEFLAAKFGAPYERYRASVNRFLPDVRGLVATLKTMPLDWRRAARREYGVVFATITAALGLTAAKTVVVGGLAASAGTLRRIGAAWLVCLTVYAVVRWMKKTLRLETTPPAETAELPGDVAS